MSIYNNDFLVILFIWIKDTNISNNAGMINLYLKITMINTLRSITNIRASIIVLILISLINIHTEKLYY